MHKIHTTLSKTSSEIQFLNKKLDKQYFFSFFLIKLRLESETEQLSSGIESKLHTFPPELDSEWQFLLVSVLLWAIPCYDFFLKYDLRITPTPKLEAELWPTKKKNIYIYIIISAKVLHQVIMVMFLYR